MTVTELANALNTTPDTVRYYTKLKLLNPIRQSNGYKSYGQEDINRLRFILSARALSFSVNDIAQLIDNAKAGKSACPLARKLIKQRLAETEAQFQQMLALRNRMQQALKQWEKLSDQAPSGNVICHLIEQNAQHLVEQ